MIKVLLFGSKADTLREEIATHSSLELVEQDPEVVVCYGGDGTLLAAELEWPGVPKVPILNSRRGRRCIPHPRHEVIARLADGSLVSNPYTKIHCTVRRSANETMAHFDALNEVNVHMGKINSAVRFQLWLNDDPYEEGQEILGDGFVIATPFGSTAYFGQITRGLFTHGIGIAFKATSSHVDHLVVPDSVVVRAQITRGPAVLAIDSSDQYVYLEAGDEVLASKHAKGTTILTCGPIRRLDEPF